jgi:hypothetical protein
MLPREIWWTKVPKVTTSSDWHRGARNVDWLVGVKLDALAARAGHQRCADFQQAELGRRNADR